MAENEKYTPTRVEDALDWGKLGVKILTSLGAMIVSGLTIKYTIDEMDMKKNDPDRYWDKQNKKGCNSAHVIADALDHVADAITNLK